MKKKQKPSALEPLVEFVIDCCEIPTKKEIENLVPLRSAIEMMG